MPGHVTTRRRDGRTVSGTERILLATDGAAAGRAALRWIIEHAGDRRVQVEIISAVGEHTSETDRHGVQSSLDRMEELLQLVLPSSDVTVAVHVGDPLQTLAGASAFNDLLVIGTQHRHARGLPQRLAMLARCPVVVVPADWLCRRGPVVVGVEAGFVSGQVLDFAEKECAATGAVLTLVHAWEMPGVGAVDPSLDLGTESIPQRQARALARLDAAARRAAPDLDIESEVTQGQIITTLRNASSRAALLVVGRPRHAGLTQALFGSLSRGLLTSPLCPVAVIP